MASSSKYYKSNHTISTFCNPPVLNTPDTTGDPSRTLELFSFRKTNDEAVK